MFDRILSSDDTDIHGSPDPDHCASLRASHDFWSPKFRPTSFPSPVRANTNLRPDGHMRGQLDGRVQSATEAVTAVHTRL
jgi:hypothetical protein